MVSHAEPISCHPIRGQQNSLTLTKSSVSFLSIDRKEAISEDIERAVSYMQSVIELGRVIRDRKTMPIKVLELSEVDSLQDVGREAGKRRSAGRVNDEWREIRSILIISLQSVSVSAMIVKTNLASTMHTCRPWQKIPFLVKGDICMQ